MTHFEKFVELCDKYNIRYEKIGNHIYMPPKDNMRTSINETPSGLLCLQRKTKTGTKTVNGNITADTAFAKIDPQDAATEGFKNIYNGRISIYKNNFSTPEDKSIERLTEQENRAYNDSVSKIISTLGKWFTSNERCNMY